MLLNIIKKSEGNLKNIKQGIRQKSVNCKCKYHKWQFTHSKNKSEPVD